MSPAEKPYLAFMMPFHRGAHNARATAAHHRPLNVDSLPAMAALPEEILSHIFTFLVAAGRESPKENVIGLQTLRNVSVASWACNRAARPSLYHTLDVDPRTNLRLVLRTLVERPETALLIRRIHIAHWATYPRESSQSQGQPGPAARPLQTQMLSAADGLNLPATVKANIRHGIASGHDEAEYALLLCLCTRLETWETLIQHPFQDRLIYDIVTSASLSGNFVDNDEHSHAAKPLQHVRHVHFKQKGESYDMRFEVFAAILKLPSLESFSSEFLNLVEYVEPTTVMRSTLKRFHLGDSRLISSIDKLAFCTLLRACPDLETLFLNCQSDDVVQLHYDIVGDALRQYGSKLVDLNLDIWTRDSDSLSGNPTPRYIGSLQPFTSLRSLFIPWGAFFSYKVVPSEEQARVLQELLPPSLRVLRIQNVPLNRDKSFEKHLSAVGRIQKSTPVFSTTGSIFTVDFYRMVR